MHQERQSEFVRLFSENQSSIYGYIYSLVPRAADAEEVFGRVTVILWEKWEHFEPDTNFRAWARKIAYHVVLNYLKRHERREQHLSEAALGCLAEEVDSDDQRHVQRLRALAQCFDELPAAQQKLVDLCYLAGSAIQSVAAKLGQTPAATYKRLSRIRQILHDCVERKISEEEA
ncbi:MAG: sigma-70 family RNA polymerase sigma factor [Planctomycetes bacterium]|nr:sigma-70 family RNA polymerase sigma factor [Planctomycetota bacterium]